MRSVVVCVLGCSCLLGDKAQDDWSLNHAFSLKGDYLYMRRSEISHEALVVDSSYGFQNSCGSCDWAKKCSTEKLVKGFDFKTGIRLSAFYDTKYTTWEALYFWLWDWKKNCSTTDTGALFFSQSHQDFSNDFANADHAQTSYETNFANGELNYIRYTTPKRTDFFSAYWIAGLRYICLPEHLDIAFTKSGSRSSYNIAVQNYLAGLQLGGGIQWNPTKKWSWDLFVKAAGFYDWAQQKTFVGDYDNSVILRNYEKNGAGYPFAVDVALNLGYQWFSCLNLHVGYQLIYLTGIATAAGQIEKGISNHHVLHTVNEAMIYGLYGGVAFSF